VFRERSNAVEVFGSRTASSLTRTCPCGGQCTRRSRPSCPTLRSSGRRTRASPTCVGGLGAHSELAALRPDRQRAAQCSAEPAAARHEWRRPGHGCRCARSCSCRCLSFSDDAFSPFCALLQLSDALTIADPGDDYVDWIGLSVYYKGPNVRRRAHGRADRVRIRTSTSRSRPTSAAWP